MSRLIITGDNIQFPWQLKINNQEVDLSNINSIKIKLVSLNHKVSYTDTSIELDKNWPGANWNTGLFIVRIPRAATSGITYQGDALLEASVNFITDIEDQTWYLKVKIITGQVD